MADVILENLTTQELIALQKKIELEKQKRTMRLTKGAVEMKRRNDIYESIVKNVKTKFPGADDNTISDFACSHYGDFTRICDLAFVNLRPNVMSDRSSAKARIAFRFNGGYLYQSLSDDEIEKYKTMYNEVVDLYMKYAEEDKNGGVSD